MSNAWDHSHCNALDLYSESYHLNYEVESSLVDPVCLGRQHWGSTGFQSFQHAWHTRKRKEQEREIDETNRTYTKNDNYLLRISGLSEHLGDLRDGEIVESVLGDEVYMSTLAIERK
jgi:hypothetical protein